MGHHAAHRHRFTHLSLAMVKIAEPADSLVPIIHQSSATPETRRPYVHPLLITCFPRAIDQRQRQPRTHRPEFVILYRVRTFECVFLSFPQGPSNKWFSYESLPARLPRPSIGTSCTGVGVAHPVRRSTKGWRVRRRSDEDTLPCVGSTRIFAGR